MQKIPGPFDRYELTREELLSARILDSTKQAFYQTMLSQYYEQRCTLLFDAQHVVQFAQQEAELRGQILLLQSLLEDSEMAKQEMLSEALDSSSDSAS